MPLSQADRAALQARAAGLLTEKQVLVAETSTAIAEASANKQDAKLIDGVAQQEAEIAGLTARKERADGSVAAALEAMQAAAEKLNLTTEVPVELPEEKAKPAPEVKTAKVVTPTELPKEA